MKYDLSKSGLKCLWEMGGSWSNTGSAMIITDSCGNAKNALYVRKYGSLACDKHAMIPVVEGDYVIQGSRHNDEFIIEIYDIKGFKDNEVILDRINMFSFGEWDHVLDEKFLNALCALREKLLCYHCREPHFIKE